MNTSNMLRTYLWAWNGKQGLQQRTGIQ
ncbi:hypothetical protein LINPERHAP1_LOCUS37843 [Linum perenne]